MSTSGCAAGQARMMKPTCLLQSREGLWCLTSSWRATVARVKSAYHMVHSRNGTVKGTGPRHTQKDAEAEKSESAPSLPSMVQLWASAATLPVLEGPSLADLPDELVKSIFEHLPGRDVAVSASLVCRQWGRVVMCEDDLWKTLFSKDFCRGQTITLSRPDATWREEYIAEWRWRHGSTRQTKYGGLSSHVYNVDFSADSNMVAGRSVDGLTKIWDRRRGTCMHTVAGARLMSCVQCDEKKIVGASLDGSIVVWDVETRQVLRTLIGHAHLATCLQFDDEKVVSGSLDRTIRVWNAESGECLQTLTGHTSTVMCLKMKGSILVSGSNDGEIKVWDLDTGECKHTMIGHKGWVSCVDFNDTHIVSGSHDCTLRIWSLETGKKIGKLRGHTGSIMCVELQGKRVVSGSLDCRVKVWDLMARKCVRSLRGHISYVSCVKFDDKRILSGADDGSVRCWELIY